MPLIDIPILAVCRMLFSFSEFACHCWIIHNSHWSTVFVKSKVLIVFYSVTTHNFLGLTDLTLNPWAPKLNISHFQRKAGFPLYPARNALWVFFCCSHPCWNVICTAMIKNKISSLAILFKLPDEVCVFRWNRKEKIKKLTRSFAVCCLLEFI